MSSKEQYKDYASTLKKEIKKLKAENNDLTSDVMESRRIIQQLRQDYKILTKIKVMRTYWLWFWLFMFGLAIGMSIINLINYFKG